MGVAVSSAVRRGCKPARASGRAGEDAAYVSTVHNKLVAVVFAAVHVPRKIRHVSGRRSSRRDERAGRKLVFLSQKAHTRRGFVRPLS